MSGLVMSVAPATGMPACEHRNVVPVESVLAEVVARLCLDCDAQLAVRP
jgi:hypothetical protein